MFRTAEIIINKPSNPKYEGKDAYGCNLTAHYEDRRPVIHVGIGPTPQTAIIAAVEKWQDYETERFVQIAYEAEQTKKKKIDEALQTLRDAGWVVGGYAKTVKEQAPITDGASSAGNSGTPGHVPQTHYETRYPYAVDPNKEHMKRLAMRDAINPPILGADRAEKVNVDLTPGSVPPVDEDRQTKAQPSPDHIATFDSYGRFREWVLPIEIHSGPSPLGSIRVYDVNRQTLGWVWIK